MSAATVSNAANTASNGATGIPAAPHSKNAAQRNRSDSPYQQRTTQKDNPTQLLIKQAVDYLIEQLNAGQSDMLAAYLRTMARFHNYSFGNILQIARQRPTATGSCLDCSKRTGHNKLLFAGVVSSNADACSDPACYSAKLDAHVKQTIAAKPKLVQITTAYGKPAEGSPVVPRNRYVEIRQDKPQKKEQRDWPEYKTCKFTTEAIVAEGSEKGELRKVCVHPDCPVHHPKKQPAKADASVKAEQEKRRREEATAQTTGLRVLSAIGKAVPVRLMKRDLLFVVERLTGMLDEQKRAILIRQHSIGKATETDASAKLLTAFLSKTDESTLGRVLVETVILLSIRSQSEGAKVLRDAAGQYKVDIDVITAIVKQEFAAKDQAKATKKAALKPSAKAAKKTAAA